MSVEGVRLKTGAADFFVPQHFTSERALPAFVSHVEFALDQSYTREQFEDRLQQAFKDAAAAIPTGFTLPAGLAAGSVVEARGEMVNSVLTLTRIELKSDNGDQAELEAEGAVTALDTGSITIQTADSGSPVTFAIPDGFTLPDGFAVGSLVDAKGTVVYGLATLTEVEIQDGGGSD